MPRRGSAGCSTPAPPRRLATPIPAPDFVRPSMTAFNSIAVIGAGAWGTARAGVAARAGRKVILCARSAEIAAAIESKRSNPKLPGVTLHAAIEVTNDLKRAASADAILIATPAQNLRDAVSALAPHLTDGAPLVACAKGIERGAHK